MGGDRRQDRRLALAPWSAVAAVVAVSLSTVNRNAIWAGLIVEECLRRGVTQFVVSPGSRSTPLVFAIDDEPRASVHVHVDERGAAFYALGWARATGRPAALICTSGTAVANYLPAIVEADADTVPLIVLSADRPARLRDTAANQTILQPGIFSNFVWTAVDLPAPDLSYPLDDLLATVGNLVVDAGRYGPVHLNCQFDEPLANTPEFVATDAWLEPVGDYLRSSEPFTIPTDDSLASNSIDLARLDSSDIDIVVIGALRLQHDQDAAVRIANAIDAPVWADVSSGLHRSPRLLRRIDWPHLTIDDPIAWKSILWLGGRVTSKRLVNGAATGRLTVVNDLAVRMRPGGRGDDDVTQIRLPLTRFAELFHAQVPTPQTSASVLPSRDRLTFTWSGDQLTDIDVLQEVTAELPSRHALWLASSMPIRLADTYTVATRDFIVGTNRGASGIDGTVASAVGFAVGHQTPTTLLIGDLAALHDVSSLAMVRESSQPLTICILNNNGGSIFQNLPVASDSDSFRRYFLTPHGRDFAGVANMMGLNYRSVGSRDGFRAAYREAVASGQSSVIEARLDASTEPMRYREIAGRVRVATSSAELPLPIPDESVKRVWLHGFLGHGDDRSAVNRAVPLALPGHGDFPMTDTLVWDDWVAACERQLATVSQPVDLIGYSMGGRLALTYALANPERVRRLVLLSAAPGIEHSVARERRRMQDHALAEQLLRFGTESFLRDWYARPMWTTLATSLGAVRLEQLIQTRSHHDPFQLACSLVSLGTGSMPWLLPRLRELPCPVLVMAGEHDRKFTGLAVDIARACPNSEVAIIADAGHAVHVEQPDRTAATIETFLT